MLDDLSPIVSVAQNFDQLLIPAEHSSRSPSDTYYLQDAHSVLRTHTSAHQTQLMRAGKRRFLVAGDVYRRDEVDASHYPVFHQMEGVRLFEEEGDRDAVLQDLQGVLEGLARHLFGEVRMRWVQAFFPFTDPSLELEIHFQDQWMEVLGCGLIHPHILHAQQLGHLHGWAFGLGLDRLAMILFDIPDIRLFWSQGDSSFFLHSLNHSLPWRQSAGHACTSYYHSFCPFYYYYFLWSHPTLPDFPSFCWVGPCLHVPRTCVSWSASFLLCDLVE